MDNYVRNKIIISNCHQHELSNVLLKEYLYYPLIENSVELFATPIPYSVAGNYLLIPLPNLNPNCSQCIHYSLQTTSNCNTMSKDNSLESTKLFATVNGENFSSNLSSISYLN